MVTYASIVLVWLIFISFCRLVKFLTKNGRDAIDTGGAILYSLAIWGGVVCALLVMWH